MKPEKEKELEKKVEDNYTEEFKGNQAPKEMPYFAGMVLKFTADTFDLVQNRDPFKWLGVKTADGGLISATALTRNRNGLGLQGKDNAERLKNMLKLFDDSGVLQIKIKDVKTREFHQPDGTTSQSNYYFFEVLQFLEIEDISPLSLLFFGVNVVL